MHIENLKNVVPEKFHRLLHSNDLESSYLSALNADRRTPLEEEFIQWLYDSQILETYNEELTNKYGKD